MLLAVPVVIALIQLLPLPEFLFPWLAPVKNRMAAAIADLVPGLELSSQITLMPGFHLFQSILLGLDICL